MIDSGFDWSVAQSMAMFLAALVLIAAAAGCFYLLWVLADFGRGTENTVSQEWLKRVRQEDPLELDPVSRFQGEAALRASSSKSTREVPGHPLRSWV